MRAGASGTAVVAALVVGALAIGFGLRGDAGDGDGPHPEPVEISSDAPRLDGPDQLAAAADLVVVATVASTADGRTVTDPADPTTGIRTRLATLVVDEVLAGEAPTPLVVEEEAALLDGTPIRVDGRSPAAVGDTGTWYLLAGDGEAFPYHALVGAQGFVPA